MAKRPYIQTPADEAGLSAGGSRTLIEQAYAQLREDILDGRLPPDEKLRVEHLKDRYGVGAGTLREAITRLVSDALVVAEGQRGFRVAPMALADLADLTQLRVQIEIEALRRSVRLGDAAWKARVQAAFDDISAIEQPLLPRDALRWEQANRRLHGALISGIDSPWTSKVLHQLSQHSERYRRAAIGLTHHDRDVHAEHALIVDMALSGQEARAALALEAHIMRTPDLLMQRLKDGAALLRPRPEPA
ncbi:GntR family transcriptional regulator [Leptothrix sp. BB-4]